MANTDCTNCPNCRARAIIYHQLIAGGEIDIVGAATELGALWSGPDRPQHALNNTAVAGIMIALERIQKMPRAEILSDAQGLGICAPARHALGRRIGQRRVQAQYAHPDSALMISGAGL